MEIPVAERLESIRTTLPQGVELVAVSKFHPVEKLQEAYAAGQRAFGESRVQELLSKTPQMPSDAVWHFIGHLQTNKVRALVPVVNVIQSVDSIRLLELINKEAARIDRVVDVMLQVHVAQEETKFGFSPDELCAELTPELVDRLKSVRIVGVMGMASNTDSESRIEQDFGRIAATFARLKKGVMANHPEFSEISMGMSDDYEIAVAYGATIVRIGSDIFGEREY